MNVVVAGTLGFDYIMDFPGKFADRIMPDKIHKISLSFLVHKLQKNFGGTAGNIAYSLNLFGVKPIIISSAGNDFLPYKKFLEKNKITTKNIFIDKRVTTGSYFVVTDQDDNQIGSFFAGATINNRNLSLTKGTFAVIAPNDPAAMNKFVNECRKKNIPYMFDPAFQIDNLTPEKLCWGVSGATIFVGNDYEISLVEKKLKITHAQLLKLARIVVTTLGNKGSVIETGNKKSVIKPAKPKNTSDPTGAGDAYRAGFLAGFLKGLPLKTCGQMGSVASVYTVEKYGTMTHNFTIIDFAKRYKENFHEELRY